MYFADKAPFSIEFVCKHHYFNCLIKELGIDSYTPDNATYKQRLLLTILNNHRSFMYSLNTETKCDDLPYLFWIPKIYKNSYKEKYITWLSSCSTKEMLFQLTQIMSIVNDGQCSSCNTSCSRRGINFMWVLKNS